MRLCLILCWIVVVLAGCENGKDITLEQQTGVYIVFTPQTAVRAVDDPDNLPEEYEIKDLSIFLTDAGSNTIINKFIHQSFSSIDNTTVMNYKLVDLPIDPATVTNKDVYVIANCADNTSLNAVETLDDLKALKTTPATATDGFPTTNGFPMYGELLGANLSNTSINSPALMTLVRACANLRVTLTFTDSSWIGTGNELMIENIAPYAYYIKNNTLIFNTSDLISYSRQGLDQISTQQYRKIVYVYESSQMPIIHIYTTIDGEEKEYLLNTNLPLPARNNLYDIEVQIYPPAATRTIIADPVVLYATSKISVKTW